MRTPNSETIMEAYRVGGFRERYAMEHGNKETFYVKGEKCIRFTYSKSDDYQDANGAAYNTVTGKWFN